MIKVYEDFLQGSEEWIQARCGVLTASQVKLIITPTLKVSNNEKSRAIVYELLAQRLSNYVEPSFMSDDMERGHIDEIYARNLYSSVYSEVKEVAFITNDKFGFPFGYSPDGLVGEEGLIEIKSRRQKFQTQTIIENEMPSDYLMQVQTALLISERKWCDYISYCGGMPMFVKRIYPDEAIQLAIINAGKALDLRLKELADIYKENAKGLAETERICEDEIILLEEPVL